MTSKELAVGIAAQVAGVLEVSDDLDWQWDDRSVKSASNPTNVNGSWREPSVTGPRVEASG